MPSSHRLPSSHSKTVSLNTGILDIPASAHDPDLEMHSKYVNPCVLFICLQSLSLPACLCCTLLSIPLAIVGLLDNAIDKADYQAADLSSMMY